MIYHSIVFVQKYNTFYNEEKRICDALDKNNIFAYMANYFVRCEHVLNQGNDLDICLMIAYSCKTFPSPYWTFLGGKAC
jgi:hypothetical protein